MTCICLMGFPFESNATSEFPDQICCCSMTVVLEMLRHAQCFDHLLKVFMFLSWQIKTL